LIVHLKYRIPVARVAVNKTSQFVLDREGCVLPLEETDTQRIPRLIWIVGKSLTAPPMERAGTTWKTATAESSDRATLDRDVVQAAKLAGFFLEPDREAEAQAEAAARIRAITVMDPGLNAGLIVETEGHAQIHWGRGPGDEEPGEPSASEKWDMLVRQAREGLDQKPREGVWSFNRSGMVFRPAASSRS
jgi:hypothetical protein